MTRGSGYLVYSDIYNLDNIVQHSGIMFGRNILIDTLREVFAKDKEYRYLMDSFGFPKTPSHVDLEADAGISDNSTTRLFIGGAFRYDISYLPAITVRQTGSSYKPISFNSNMWVLEYETQRTIDGYGNVTFAEVPASYQFAGAWEQSFEVKITSKSLEDTIHIADIVMISLQGTYRLPLQQNGLFIKQVRSSGESVETYGSNDPLFTISVTLDTYSEWRRSIPISNLVERISVCMAIDIQDTDVPANDMFVKMNL